MTQQQQPTQQQVVDMLKAAILAKVVDLGGDGAVAAPMVDELIQGLLDFAKQTGQPPGLGLTDEMVADLRARVEVLASHTRSPEQASDSDVVAEQQRIQDHN